MIDVLMMEKISERGNAEPYTLSKRCKPHVVLLYVIILSTREPCNAWPRSTQVKPSQQINSVLAGNA